VDRPIGRSKRRPDQVSDLQCDAHAHGCRCYRPNILAARNSCRNRANQRETHRRQEYENLEALPEHCSNEKNYEK
jgi:hypothetical protein